MVRSVGGLYGVRCDSFVKLCCGKCLVCRAAGRSRDLPELFFPAQNTAEGRAEIPAGVSPDPITAEGGVADIRRRGEDLRRVAWAPSGAVGGVFSTIEVHRETHCTLCNLFTRWITFYKDFN